MIRQPDGCTTVIVGRQATTDGSVLATHTAGGTAAATGTHAFEASHVARRLSLVRACEPAALSAVGGSPPLPELSPTQLLAALRLRHKRQHAHGLKRKLEQVRQIGAARRTI